MTEPLETAFIWFYRGRHRPEDAWWWLTHPADSTPDGTEPVQRQLLEAADDLDQQGLHDAAASLRNVTAEVLAADRRTARAALIQAQQYLDSGQHHTGGEQDHGCPGASGTPTD